MRFICRTYIRPKISAARATRPRRCWRMLGFARNPDMGYTDVFLYADDPAAIRLYEKLGFRGTPVREYRAFKGGLPDLYTEAKE